MVIMKKQECKADPTLIKNPFICNSAKGVRLSLDKDPRRFKGNTQFITPHKLANGNTYLNNQVDLQLRQVFLNKILAHNYHQQTLIYLVQIFLVV